MHEWTCSRCGSKEMPSHVRRAVNELSGLEPNASWVVKTAASSLFLYGSEAKQATALYDIIEHLAPSVREMIREFGPSETWMMLFDGHES